ncbi:MAG: hypothetical protein EXS38_08560 [Opitutus sp.]|nr:hypothetical protein [Opitutus sp.]
MRSAPALAILRHVTAAGLLLLVSACALVAPAADKKVLLIAGLPSHAPGAHEHNAGMLLLQKCLAGVPGLKTEVTLNGWPKDNATLAGFDAVFIYCDGGDKHVALQGDHLQVLDALAARGAGIGFLHYAVEPTIAKGQAEFIRWVGGCFEINWSINPTWEANFKSLPAHPISRGVRPFTARDEWYFHLRFADGLTGVTPLLVDVPTAAATLTRADGPHAGNPAARAAVARHDPQTVAWCFERPGGGRGFGFTGGHYHSNWGNDDLRKLVLNAIVWTAKLEVPAGGVASTVSAEELAVNLDPKTPRKARPPAADRPTQ